MTGPHITDEELLLDFYGEATPEQRQEIRAHLEQCARCRALDRELRAVLALVDREPAVDPPPGFEQELWARLEPVVSASRGPARLEPVVSGERRAAAGTAASTPWSFEWPRWVLAASVAALAAGSFSLGRVWDGPAQVTAPAADARDLGELVFRSEVEEHLERSQRVFVELVNADDEAAPVVLASDRDRAADLVAAGRLYRRSAEEIGDTATRDLLEDVERVLVEIANGSADETSNALSEVRARISEQDLIFRLRVMTAAMRARDERAGFRSQGEP